MERAEAAEALLRQRDAELRRLSNQQVQDGSNSMILPSSSSFDDNEVSEATVKALLHKNPAIFQALLSMARSSAGDEDSDISSRRSSVNNVDLAQAQILSEFITRIVFAAMVPSDDSAKDSKATNEHQLNKSLQLANMTLKLAGESWAFLRERTEAMLDLQVAKAKYLTSSPSALSGGLQNQQERQESVLSLPQKHVFAPPLSLALKSTGKISTGHELVRTRTIDDSLTSASFETAADEINAQSISTATGTKDLRGYSSAALADSKMKPSSKVDNLPSNLSRRDTKIPDPALAIEPKDRADIEKRRKLPSSSSTSQSKSGGGISASTLATLKSASKHAHRIVRSKTPVGGRSTNSSSSSSPPLPPLPPSSLLIISPPPNSPPADVAALAADSNKAALVALENSKKLVSSVVAESSGGENCIVAPSTDVIDAKQKSQAVREGKSIMSRGSYSANDVLSKESDSQSSDVSAGSSKSIFSVATAPSSSLADARLRLRSRGANTGSLADRIAAWKNVSSSLSGSVSSTSSLSSSSVGKVLSPVTPPSGAAPTPAPTPTSVAKPRLSKPLSTISKKNSAPPTSPLKSSSSGSPHHRSASPMSKRSASPMRPPTISPPPSMAATSVPQEVPSMSAKTSIMHIHAEKSLETSQTDGMTDQVTTSANQSNPISPQSSPYSLPVGSDERIGRRTSWESLQSKVDAAVALAASSRGGKSKPQEVKILHDSDRDHGDLETNVAELQQKTKNTEGEKDKKEAEVGMEVAIAETCNYQLRGEDIPPRDNESFSLTLNGTQHTSVTVPEAVPTNYAEHVAPKSESDDMSIETKKEHSSKIKSESAIPLEGVPPIPSIANTATSTGTNQSLSPSAKIEVKETLQANNTENGTEASKSVGVAGGGDNSKKPSEIAIKLWAAPKYHKNRQHCSNTSTGKWSSDAKGVEEEERASSPIAERVRQWKQATSNGSLASSKNCDNNNSNEGEQGPRKSYSPSSSHHRNNGPNGQRSLSAGQVRQMAERTESPSSLSAISQDKKKQAAAAFASASSSSPSPGRGRFPRGSSPNPNNWSGGFRAHPGSSNQAGVVNTNKKEDNVPSRSANSSPLRGRGVTSNHAEKTVETLPDVDSTPDIEGGQHQSKQRKGRQTSPLIERKLAQWKATSASSDDVNAMKRSPSPTQPDGASDTVSSAAGPWRQNRVLSASGINKRVSESPGRRAGSPVSERVKQWKQQAAHAVKQAAQSAQDNKNLNGKKGGNTQQRAASASKLPPQGTGFSGAREASPLANRSSSTRLIKNGIGEQRFVAPTVLRRRATSPSPQRALLPLKGSTEAAARSTGNGTNEKKDIESKKDKKSEVGGDSSKAPLVTAAVVTDSGGTILTTASTLVPRPPSPALLASKQISSMTPQSTNKEGTTGISDTRGRRGSSNSVLGSSGGLRTVRGTGDNGNGLPSGLSFIQPKAVRVGDSVSALFDDDSHYYAATVARVVKTSSGNLAMLRFDDGDERSDVPLKDILVKQPGSATVPGSEIKTSDSGVLMPFDSNVQLKDASSSQVPFVGGTKKKGNPNSSFGNMHGNTEVPSQMLNQSSLVNSGANAQLPRIQLSSDIAESVTNPSDSPKISSAVSTPNASLTSSSSRRIASSPARNVSPFLRKRNSISKNTETNGKNEVESDTSSSASGLVQNGRSRESPSRSRGSSSGGGGDGNRRKSPSRGRSSNESTSRSRAPVRSITPSRALARDSGGRSPTPTLHKAVGDEKSETGEDGSQQQRRGNTSPLRDYIRDDTSHGARHVKKELAQLDMLREEVARIRRMNEAEMPAIGERDHREESESDAESVSSPIKATAIMSKAMMGYSSKASGKKSPVKKDEIQQSTSDIVESSSRSRSRSRRRFASNDALIEEAPSSSGSAETAAVEKNATDAKPRKTRRSVSPVIAERLRNWHDKRGAQQGSTGITTTDESGMLSDSTLRPRAPSPVPQKNERNTGMTSQPPSLTAQLADFRAAPAQQAQAPRSMSPLIAQRMAAFHGTR